MRGAHGIGLRAAHYDALLRHGLPASTGLGWAELITENFLDRGGRPRAVLERVRADVSVVLHGVSLTLGGLDPLPCAQLRKIRALKEEASAAWVSDHLCFGGFGERRAYDLWPLPFTAECVRHVAARIAAAQHELGERMLVENVSAYVEHECNELSEPAFVAAVLEEADCDLLLDVNNVHVNAVNHGFDAHAYLDALPARRVRQMHVAGHLDCGDYLLDDHGREVSSEVWALYRHAVARFGEVPTIVEWDGEVPPLERVIEEARVGQEQARLAAFRGEERCA
jgi:uncharacterized protein (UPF0276 family)